MVIYIGTYTSGKSHGLYVGNLDLATGSLTVTSTTVQLEHPSYLAVDPQRFRLYVLSEVSQFGEQHGGAVSAFALDPNTGTPTLLNSCSSGGEGPCHLSIDPAGRFILVANYGGGSVALLPLLEDGSLAQTVTVVSHEGSSVNTMRQNSPHVHFITMDPAGRYALAVDLGTDAIEVYEIDVVRGRLMSRPLSRTAVKAGVGPRHLAFHPTGRYAYVINELDSTLTAWQYDTAQGRLSEIQTLSTLPVGFTGPNYPADVHVHPSGSFVYGSNRGHDSIALFTINAETGTMSLRNIVPSGGRTPRGFAIDPTGAYLVVAHQDTDTITTFRIDPATGDLTPSGCTVRVPSPTCVKMLSLLTQAL